MLWISFLYLESKVGLLFARAYAIASHKKLVFMMLALLGTTAIALSMIAIPNNKCISSSNTFALCKMFNLLLKNRVHDLYYLLQLEGPKGPKETLYPNCLSSKVFHSFSFIAEEVKIYFRFVLTISLADAVTEKALRPTLQGIISTLENCLSTIIICHFHLDLQQRNDHPNGSNTSHSLPHGSFHAVKERIHRAVVNEFGDLSFNESFGTEGSQEDIELQAMQAPSGVAEIDLQEFPWAGGDIGDEEAGPVASGSGILRE
ncbi:hypothetical protein K439DRAFT_1623529 [Ramaria rubella]|nr:hypothetical protein K439DRAFT_1623529 [Ramaria rubella]